MKTIEDYMNDPAIADEPRPVREIHAARLMLQDERKGMTPSEYSQAAEDSTIAIFKKYGLPLVWADLKPVTPAIKR
ncbi:hypothetical protein AGMMS49942_28550 [Spirochaetia bacterium]|nr:hypothetical protein AGMMS49942_28550 [Spirochaetia bacterium]